jgi:NMD protein affecting ribosome stability and mRNA decay
VLARRLFQFGVFFVALQVYAQGPQRPAQKQVIHNPHGALNIPCENCHTSLSWKPIRSIPEFDHDKTSYPLRGMHEKVQCTQCHVKLVFANVGQKCSDCHADIHRGQFGGNCESCHTVKGWKVSVQAIRNHQNRFPLIGAHSAVDCESCHKGAATGQFQGLSTQCYSCHATDYKGTANPNHATAGFPTSCEQCHNSNNWLDAKFDHSKTGFPLTNAHADPPRICLDCHINNNYNLTTTACVSCHLKNFQGATNPNHVAGGFSQTCQQCHNTSAWQPASFDHTSVGFPLTNAHADPPRVCLDCHINNNYNLTTTACASCHLKDYNTATSPVNHVQLGFPTACESCHDTVLWTDGKFDHAATGFVLTNSHLVPPRVCADCHINNNYSLTSANTACAACHLKDYNNATTPINHIQVGFPTTCQLCHDTTLWTNATFNHNNTVFPLTGFHVKVPCASCHVNNNYTTLPTDCYGCHAVDYNGTTNPIHKAAPTVFTTACATCHNTTAWTGATFNHTWWNVNHGNAAGVCATCHTNANDYTIFQCTNCHGKAQTDARHQGNPNYVYNSVNCYQCHKH